MVIPRCFRWVTFLVSSDALRHSRVWGEATLSSFYSSTSFGISFLDPLSGSALCLSIYAVYDEYHKAKTWKRHPYSPHLPRTDFTISPTGSSFFLATTVSICSHDGGLVGLDII